MSLEDASTISKERVDEMRAVLEDKILDLAAHCSDIANSPGEQTLNLMMCVEMLITMYVSIEAVIESEDVFEQNMRTVGDIIGEAMNKGVAMAKDEGFQKETWDFVKDVYPWRDVKCTCGETFGTFEEQPVQCTCGKWV